MPTRNVVITEHQAELIDRLVQGGRYQNASEVLREGLRLIEERDKEQAARLEGLKAALKEGMEELDRGEFKEFATAKSLAGYLDRLTDEVIAKRKPR